MKSLPDADPWSALRRFTHARIALGRAGSSLPTREVLAFGLAHARARDAVHHPLDRDAVAAAARAAGFETVAVHSAAPDRAHYLRRPDLGRRLDDASRERLVALRTAQGNAGPPQVSLPPSGGGNVGDVSWGHSKPPDLVLVIADGLSAVAAERHALPVIEALRPHLPGWALAPLVIAEQARVALGDDIGACLGARQVVMLIGERPGLSSPDSLGLYLTHGPRPGLTDAQRNCISNVRPEGLPYAAAATRLAYLLHGARRLGRSGIELKDDSDGILPSTPPPAVGEA